MTSDSIHAWFDEGIGEGGELSKHHTWVLVAGTGHHFGVPADVCLAAEEVGAAIARFGCGLVTGGWAGVDYLVAKAFAVEVEKGNRLEDRLVQVVQKGRRADFNRGRIVYTNAGPLEWLEPQAYCDAGEGWTDSALMASLVIVFFGRNRSGTYSGSARHWRPSQ